MNATKRNKLKTLRDDGHEIAYHTLNHPWVDSTYSEKDIRHYVELELDSGMALMAADGFTLRSFAFPGGFSIPPLVDSAKARFATVRTYNFGFHEYWKQSQQYQLRADDPSRTLIPYGIDKASGFLNLAQWDLIMKDIYAGKSVSLLFHAIDDRNPYSTHPPWFMQIIREIHSQKIPCKTVGEFFGY
jgi:peptidoglycan/xylan/chitin deacetylase (PgdA/CDA1 family)